MRTGIRASVAVIVLGFVAMAAKADPIAVGAPEQGGSTMMQMGEYNYPVAFDLIVTKILTQGLSFEAPGMDSPRPVPAGLVGAGTAVNNAVARRVTPFVAQVSVDPTTAMWWTYAFNENYGGSNPAFPPALLLVAAFYHGAPVDEFYLSNNATIEAQATNAGGWSPVAPVDSTHYNQSGWSYASLTHNLSLSDFGPGVGAVPLPSVALLTLSLLGGAGLTRRVRK